MTLTPLTDTELAELEAKTARQCEYVMVRQELFIRLLAELAAVKRERDELAARLHQHEGKYDTDGLLKVVDDG